MSNVKAAPKAVRDFVKDTNINSKDIPELQLLLGDQEYLLLIEDRDNSLHVLNQRGSMAIMLGDVESKGCFTKYGKIYHDMILLGDNITSSYQEILLEFAKDVVLGRSVEIDDLNYVPRYKPINELGSRKETFIELMEEFMKIKRIVDLHIDCLVLATN